MARKNALIFYYSKKTTPRLFYRRVVFIGLLFNYFLRLNIFAIFFSKGKERFFEWIQGLFRHTDRHTVFVGKYDFNYCNRGIIDCQSFVFWIIFFQNFQCVFGGITQQSHIRFVDQNIFKSDITAFADSIKKEIYTFFSHIKRTAVVKIWMIFWIAHGYNFFFYTRFSFGNIMK